MHRLILCAAALALAWPACADSPRGRIRSVETDSRLGLLALEVDGFPAEGAVEVRLDGHPRTLAIVSRGPDRIVARLPEGLGWALYVVRVAPAAKPEEAAGADFVYGVVGPPVGDP
jgi:hypothetical protein